MVDITGTPFDDVLEDEFPDPGADGADRLLGLGGNDQLYGGKGNDRLEGGAGNDILDGESGNDYMLGGPGDDVYFHLEFDRVEELANEGVDTIYWYTQAGRIPDHVENVVLLNPRGQITGNALPNEITGNAGPNRLFGEGGADVLIGLGGDDYYGIDPLDTIVEAPNQGVDTVSTFTTSYTLLANFENLVGLGGGVLTGNAVNNVIRSTNGATNDTLDGKAGADTMIGGAGNDLYIADNQQDVVQEQANEGVDTVRSSVNFTLYANVEVLELTGAAQTGRGSTGDNTILGTALANLLEGFGGNDTLDGKSGADSMFGGIGQDSYYVDQAADLVTEYLNEGLDTVYASVSWVLGANVEALVLTGSANLNGTGNELGNALTGNAGANVLNGLAGADVMQGGLGNDTYYVDTVPEFVFENENQGIDTVYASVSHFLGVNVENLNLTGALDIDGTGNALANRIVGNTGDNRLDGKAGADYLAGGAGNDTYIVDNALDVVSELLNAGTDTVESSISWTLGVFVERLFLTGMGSVNATGNALANFILGNDAHNRIDGLMGADTMIGGGGNDTYVVDNAGDVIDEAANDGTDTVESAVSVALGLNVENLTLTNVIGINGTGNDLANRIMGNGAANVIDGRLGADILSGGLGADTFVFSQVNAVDTITDFSAPFDTMRLSNAAFGNAFTVGAPVTLVQGSIPTSTQLKATVLYDTDDGRLLVDRDGTGLTFAPVWFATLTGAPAIATGDFVVVA